MRTFILSLGFAVLLGTVAHAATLPALRTAYDATATIDFGTTHFDSTVNADGQKERRTFDGKAGQQTVILRHDQGKNLPDHSGAEYRDQHG